MKSYILSRVWLCCCLCFMRAGYAQYTEFRPGQVWNDTDGNPINAHGGGMLYHEGTYYWYGEYKKGKTVLFDGTGWECYRTDVTGGNATVQMWQVSVAILRKTCSTGNSRE